MLKSKSIRIIALLSVIVLFSTALVARPTSALVSQNSTAWFWTSDTNAAAIAVGDVDGDGANEIVSAGYYNDGLRFVTQLFIWNASTLVLEKTTTWYWINDTTITSVALANITGGPGLNIVTGGSFFDGNRWIAQVIVWNGVSLVAEKIATWYWFGDTQISSVAVANVTGGTTLDIVTGGAFFDNTRWIAQLIVWNSSTMAAQKITAWYWTSDTYINSVAVANVTGGTSLDIITAGSYNDGLRNNAQIIGWTGSTLTASTFATWFVSSDTRANSVAVANIGVLSNRVIAGGSYFDGVRENAQITVWG